jgi:hypothetical protein
LNWRTARPESVEGRAQCSWFDKLTTSGKWQPLLESYSLPGDFAAPVHRSSRVGEYDNDRRAKNLRRVTDPAINVFYWNIKQASY